ncbi:MAG: GNAT family N-acetyltransferase [Actinophytocola sp.]|nr:GNAT family N-acetyltransferase [Actinophytocola sp.]
MPELTVRAATEDDADVLLRWRNDPVTRRFSRNHDVVRPAAHAAWLADVLAAEDRVLFVLEADGVPVATARYDKVGPGTWESNAAVAPEARGRGLGAEVLVRTQDVLRERWDAHTVVGMVHEDNVASLAMLRQAGYVVRDDVPAEPPFVAVACSLSGARV